MKWFWWVGGAAAYIIIKTDVGLDSLGMWILVITILAVSSTLGENSEAAAKKREQEERDRQASEAAHDALKDFRLQEASKEAKGRPQK